MSGEIHQAFIRSIVHYLKQRMDSNPSAEMAESLEVAMQCLEAAYDIAPSNNIENEASTAAPAASTSSASTSTSTSTNQFEIDLFQIFQTAFYDNYPNKKNAAELLKYEGNKLMKEGKYQEALLHYNRGLNLDATNPVLYCNRAAAYIRLHEFERAIADCNMSLIYNPNYSKAYGRIGIAYFNLRKYEEARNAYKKAFELDPDNQEYQNNYRLVEEQIALANTATAAGGGTGAGSGASNGTATGTGTGDGVNNTYFSSPEFRNTCRQVLNDANVEMVLSQILRNPVGIFDPSALFLLLNMLKHLTDSIYACLHLMLKISQSLNTLFMYYVIISNLIYFYSG